MTKHDDWIDQLSDYIDGELEPAERDALEAHLEGCAACAAVLDDLKRVVERAQELPPRPPEAELWRGIAARIEVVRQPRRVSFTIGQLAAAAALVAAVSGGLAWTVAERAGASSEAPATQAAAVPPAADPEPAGEPRLQTVSLADAEYDAAVSDLERALKEGRGRLDASTIAIVEHNLQTIDQAIRQAREALVGDPSNSYLSSHLVEARRRKLDLLRRATALVNEAD